MEAFFGGIQRQIVRSADTTYSQLEALVGLYRELDGLPALPPMRRWAVSPDAARELRSLVVSRRPELVVELGSGVSTILLGMLVREQGSGWVVAIEHDPVFWAESAARVEAFGLDTVVEVRYAPMVPLDLGGHRYTWYDLGQITFDHPIDLVVVDGPPEASGPQARYPALPVLADRCADGCAFFLDDYVRRDEQAMVRRWVDEHGAVLVDFSNRPEKWTAVVELGRSNPEATGGDA